MREHHCFDKVKEWHGRPNGFRAKIVMEDANPVPPFDPITPDEIADLYNMDSVASEPGAEAESACDTVIRDDDVDDENVGWELCDDTKSKSKQEAIAHYNTLMCLNTEILESGDYASKGKSGLCVQCADGAWVPLAKALTVWQWKEWVSRERGPRFWVGLLPEHRMLPPGHNCTLGTLLVIALSPGVIALVRVHRVDKSGAEFGVKSCKLVPGAQNILLAAELVWMTSIMSDAGTEFTASGLFLPSVSSNQVLNVSPTLLPSTQGSNNAVMDTSRFAAHGTFITQDGFSSLRSSYQIETLSESNDAHSMQDDSDIALCCRCSKGWWSDATGNLVSCTGPCSRLFHACCAEVDTTNVDWQCMRCSGVDDAVCSSCDKEWYCDQKETADGSPNEYYTGAMLQCCGDKCGLWYHQQCHQPKIDDTYVAKQTLKSRSKGKRGNWAGKPWRCDACVQHNSAGAINKSRKTTVQSSTESALPDLTEHTPMATEWLCMSCNTITPVECTQCSEPTCMKPYAGYGALRYEDTTSTQARVSRRHKAPTVHDGLIPWGSAGTQIRENRTNREKIHCDMINPAPKDPAVEPCLVVQDEPTIAYTCVQWSCTSCNTVSLNEVDVCSEPSCQKPRSRFGLDAPCETVGPQARPTRSKH
jgi:hypothetical protein